MQELFSLTTPPNVKFLVTHPHKYIPTSPPTPNNRNTHIFSSDSTNFALFPA